MAEEIQDSKNVFEMGDFMWKKERYWRVCNTVTCPKNNDVWLPRQDDLQKMSGLSWWEFDRRCNEIRRYLLESPISNYEVGTKEQAGICVVMEKYGKIWSDEKEDWVKEA